MAIVGVYVFMVSQDWFVMLISIWLWKTNFCYCIWLHVIWLRKRRVSKLAEFLFRFISWCCQALDKWSSHVFVHWFTSTEQKICGSPAPSCSCLLLQSNLSDLIENVVLLLLMQQWCVILSRRASDLCQALCLDSSSLLSTLQVLKIWSHDCISFGKTACASQLCCKSKIHGPCMKINLYHIFNTKHPGKSLGTHHCSRSFLWM